MNEWKEYKIHELGKVVTGTTPSSKNPEDFGHDIMFVTPSDYKSYTNYLQKTVRYLSIVGKDKLKNRVLPKGSVMVTCIGSDMGKVALNPVEVITNQQVNSIIPNNTINNIFLYYKLKDEYDTLRMYGGEGTAVPIVNKSTFENIELLIPSLPEQKRIGELLSSLDDKIDLLQRNSKTIEHLAEVLFRQWFESIENEKSTIMNIEDVANVQNGYSFKSSEFISEQLDSIEVLKMGHISADGGLRPSPKKDFIKRNEKYNKWILNKRDIILAMTDMKDNVVILGVPALIDHDNKYVLNQRVGRIVLHKNSLIESILILYMQMKEKNFISELQSKGNSGVQVNLGTDTIRQTKILVPTKEYQMKILPQLNSIFDKLDHNRIQVQNLETLRDTLLPKLMSGLVRVEN